MIKDALTSPILYFAIGLVVWAYFLRGLWLFQLTKQRSFLFLSVFGMLYILGMWVISIPINPWFATLELSPLMFTTALLTYFLGYRFLSKYYRSEIFTSQNSALEAPSKRFRNISISSGVFSAMCFLSICFFANKHFDVRAQKTVETTVIGHFKKFEGRGSIHPYARLNAEFIHKDSIYMQISSNLYDKLGQGQWRSVVNYSNGLLGFPWLRSACFWEEGVMSKAQCQNENVDLL